MDHANQSLSRRRLLSGSAASLAASSAVAADDTPEPVIEPGLPIIDPHHHLWDNPAVGNQPARKYVLKDFLTDADSGHNVVASVFVECSTQYRKDGPVEMRSVGETEFVAAIADDSASGRHGPTKVAAGIISHVNLDIGDAARGVLEAHLSAGGGRVKGIRDASAWDEFPVMGRQLEIRRKELLMNPAFRRGFAALKPLGLLFESWIFHPQIPQLTDLARAFPDTTIILNHVGTPIGVGPYAAKSAEVFAAWKMSLLDLAKMGNVKMKLGGLGMAFTGFPQFGRKPTAGSSEIAETWRPYVETCIAAFGVNRCMFESNFPPDAGTCSYRTLWNVFKVLARGLSGAEKTALFSGTAAQTYGLKV